VTVTAPVAAPVVAGLKATVSVQLALAASVEPQVVLSAKLPLAAMLLMSSVALPVFDKVTLCVALVVPTACEEKLRLDALNDTVGLAAFTVTLTFELTDPPAPVQVSV
jgi:hypothetical protein